MRNFYQVLDGIDPAPLLAQLSDVPTASAEEECFPYPPLPVKWRKLTEWTHKKNGSEIYNEYNIVLRYLTLGQERDTGRLYLYEADREREYWDRPAFRVLSEARPIVQRLLAAVGDILGHVIITRLPPGGSIKPHTDQWRQDVPRFWNRHQVPLLGRCRFKCGDEELLMQPRSAHWIDNWQLHSVETDEERISMIVDLHLF